MLRFIAGHIEVQVVKKPVTIRVLPFRTSEYKRIFAWEYLHRLLARLLGLAFVVPLALFAKRRRLPREFGRRLVGIFALGALQGVAGWWMVASGLVDEPRVSHLRLTVHLGLALLLFAALLSAALELAWPRPAAARRGAAAALAGALVIAVFLQALAGADLVAADVVAQLVIHAVGQAGRAFQGLD